MMRCQVFAWTILEKYHGGYRSPSNTAICNADWWLLICKDASQKWN